MTAPKAKTLQARFGFSDPELTTPKHDQIMLWLDANIDQVLTDALCEEWTVTYINGVTIDNELIEISQAKTALQKLSDRADGIVNRINELKNGYSQYEWEIRHKQDELKSIRPDIEALTAIAKEAIQIPPKAKWVIRHNKKIWESPIVSESARTARTISQSSYTIGFVDMKVMYSQPAFRVAYDNESTKVRFEVLQRGRSDTAYFEVKPSIPSLGEVIRQIRMYQTYTGHWPWFIVSPDDRFAEQLRDQGIGFVKVPNTL